MIMKAFYSAAARLMFLTAFGLLSLAVLEAIVNLFGYTILRGTYTAGRILEFSAILLIFVITMLLRQLRDQSGAASGSH